jgi:hypothetical protein
VIISTIAIREVDSTYQTSQKDRQAEIRILRVEIGVFDEMLAHANGNLSFALVPQYVCHFMLGSSFDV